MVSNRRDAATSNKAEVAMGLPCRSDSAADGRVSPWRRRLARVWLSLAMLPLGTAHAGSIFDEDWVPPQRSEPASPLKPPAVPPAPPTGQPPVEPAKPAVGPEKTPTPTAPPVVRAVPDSPAAAPARLAIPSKADQARLRKVMREIFAKEIADRSLIARKRLAQTLLREAAKVAEQPVDRYVLLGGAYEAATDAQAAKLSFEAADAMAGAFEVDGRAMKLAVLAATGRGGDPEDAKAVVAEGLAIIDAAVADNDYDAVGKASAAVELAAVRARDPALLAEAREQVKAARAIGDHALRVQKELATLRAAPNDPFANLAVGRFLCFVKGDWERGLPMLSRGADPALRALADKEAASGNEIGGPADVAAALLALADGWWDLAERELIPGAKGAIRGHAAELYEQAAPELAGLAKAKAEKRAAEVAAAQLANGAAPAGGRRPGVPRVQVAQGGDAAEAGKVIADVAAKYPDMLKGVKRVTLAKVHDGASLRRHAGGPRAMPGAFSAAPVVGASDGIMLWGVYEEWDPGKYLVVYRVQLLSDADGGNVCFLDVCKGGHTIAECRPAAKEFKPNGWQAMPIQMTLSERATVEYRLWPHRHTIALDRIYIYRLP